MNGPISLAALPADLVRKLDVQVLPLGFVMEGKTYHDYPDHRDMDPRVFYDRLRKGEAHRVSTVYSFRWG